VVAPRENPLDGDRVALQADEYAIAHGQGVLDALQILEQLAAGRSQELLSVRFHDADLRLDADHSGFSGVFHVLGARRSL
jgi:hypothetical protein